MAKGYLICRVCGKREPQDMYDCDILIVCKECDATEYICQGNSCYLCESRPDDCNE